MHAFVTFLASCGLPGRTKKLSSPNRGDVRCPCALHDSSIKLSCSNLKYETNTGIRAEVSEGGLETACLNSLPVCTS